MSAATTTTNAPPVVALIGASGHLGLYIARALHTARLSGKIRDLVILSRIGSPKPAEIAQWDKSGTVTFRGYLSTASAVDLASMLQNVDILINTIGTSGYQFRDRLLEGISKSEKVKLYFPSEFGVDHTVHDFSHPEWDHKKEHMRLAREIIPNVRICRVFAGLFTEDSIGPWFGFDTKKGVYECYGSQDTKVSFTSLGDVGKAVAELVGNSMEVGQVPEQVHLSGDRRSFREIGEIMGVESGGRVEIVERDLGGSRIVALREERPDPSACLRFLMGEGKIDHSKEGMGNDNELVNPRQSRWKWWTIKDEARAHGGKPWADTSWE